jgi:hypothetical protein
MDGPSHYREAERLLAAIRGTVDLHAVSLAQVHATLALAAAVGGLDAAEGPGGGSATGRTFADGAAWLKITEHEAAPLFPGDATGETP